MYQTNQNFCTIAILNNRKCNILTDSIQTLMNSGSSNGGFTIPLLPWKPQQTNKHTVHLQGKKHIWCTVNVYLSSTVELEEAFHSMKEDKGILFSGYYGYHGHLFLFFS